MGPRSAPDAVEVVIASISGRQWAVVTRRELLAAGVTSKQIRRRVQSGRLRGEYPGVYAATATPLTAEGRWLAAVRACEPHAFLSHRSAAALWKIRQSEARIADVSVAGRNGRTRRRGIRVHRPTRLQPFEVTVRDGVPVTTVPRTLLDLAAVLPRRALERAIDESERQDLLDHRALRRTLEANHGRRGSAALDALLQSHAAGSTATRTELEEAMFRLCARHGIERPRVNVPIGRYTADFLWPEHRLIVETDGRQSHGTRAAFEHDRARDAWLTAEGYRVVRFTYRQVLNEPDKVARLIARLLQPAPRSPA